MGLFNLFGGDTGGSSSSSTTTSTTTNATDRRQAVGNGGGSVSGDNSRVQITTTDGGAVKNALASNDATLTKAINLLKAGDATNAEGFEKLLSTADKFFTSAQSTLTDTGKDTLSKLETMLTARNDQAGAIDQKTIIVIAIAAAITFGVVLKK